jgi:hypothetical protein
MVQTTITDDESEREKFFISKRDNFVNFIKSIAAGIERSPADILHFEEELNKWANKPYSKMKEEAAKLRVIILSGLEKEFLKGVMATFKFAEHHISPEDIVKLLRYLELFSKC